MFLLVLVTCVTLEQQTMCHEFPREIEFLSENSCQRAAAMERGRYNSRMQRRAWARYSWKCRNGTPSGVKEHDISLSYAGSADRFMVPDILADFAHTADKCPSPLAKPDEDRCKFCITMAQN